MFEQHVYAPQFHPDRQTYRPEVENDDFDYETYPYYYTKAWSPFPFLILGRYGAMWGFTGGHGGRRVYVWLVLATIELEEYDRWDS